MYTRSRSTLKKEVFTHNLCRHRYAADSGSDHCISHHAMIGGQRVGASKATPKFGGDLCPTIQYIIVEIIQTYTDALSTVMRTRT